MNTKRNDTFTFHVDVSVAQTTHGHIELHLRRPQGRERDLRKFEILSRRQADIGLRLERSITVHGIDEDVIASFFACLTTTRNAIESCEMKKRTKSALRHFHCRRGRRSMITKHT